MENYTLKDLMDLLSKDPIFSYTFKQEGKYELIATWVEPSWGEMSKIIISEDKYVNFKKLLIREVKNLYK